jgi:predicted Zn-dependent protease
MSKNIHLNAPAELYVERPDLFMAAAAGIADVGIVQNREMAVVSGGLEAAFALSTLQQSAYNRSRAQVELDRYASLIVGGTDRENDNFVLTDEDVYMEGTNFVFGATMPWHGLSVQSAARFVRTTSSQSLQRHLIRHVARHEYGHLVGLNAAEDYKNPDVRGGIYEGHCADECTMQQVMSVPEAAELTEKLKDRELAGFCAGCVRGLRARA